MADGFAPLDVGEPPPPDPVAQSPDDSIPGETPAPDGYPVGYLAPPLDRLPLALRALRDLRREWERMFEIDAYWADEMNMKMAERNQARTVQEEKVAQARAVVDEILVEYAMRVTGTDPMTVADKMP